MANKTSFKKGYTPWNKGLTKIDPRVQKNIDGASATFKERYAKGEIKEPWNKGKTKLEDVRLMSVSKAITGIKRSQETIEKSRINAGKRIREQYANGERRWWGLDPKNKEVWERVGKNFGTPEARKKAFQALRNKPNKLEKYLDKILQENFPKQWKFVGDGKIMIGRKFPDFIFLGDQKKVVLLNGIYWHTKFRGIDDSVLNRKVIEDKESGPYKEFSYKVLHIWEDELASFTKGGKYIFDRDTEAILDKVRNF